MADFREMAERAADRVLRASGSGLKNYTSENRAIIVLAALDGIEEAYRAGADFALAKVLEAKLYG